MCMVKPCCILAERFGLFVIRLASLSRWKMDFCECGITLVLFTRSFLRVLFFVFIFKKITMVNYSKVVCLRDGYNVAHLQESNIDNNIFITRKQDEFNVLQLSHNGARYFRKNQSEMHRLRLHMFKPGGRSLSLKLELELELDSVFS